MARPKGSKSTGNGAAAKPDAAPINRIAGASQEMQEAMGGELMNVPPLKIGRVEVVIVGDSPLLVHRFSEKAQKQIEEKQAKAAKKSREARDPESDYLGSMYLINGTTKDLAKAVHGVPAAGFKKMMVRAGKLVGIPMTEGQTIFQIEGDPRENTLVELKYEKVEMHTHPVRVGPNKVADMRYRAVYTGWSIALVVRFDAGQITASEVVNLLARGGAFVGYGEWRPEKSGTFGTFRVESCNLLPTIINEQSFFMGTGAQS